MKHLAVLAFLFMHHTTEKLVGKMTLEAIQTLIDELSITSQHINISMTRVKHNVYDVVIEWY